MWSDWSALQRHEAWEPALDAARQLCGSGPGPLSWPNLSVLSDHLRPAVDSVFREALRSTARGSAWHGLARPRAQGQYREALRPTSSRAFRTRLAQACYRLGNLHEHYEDYAEAIRAYR